MSADAAALPCPVCSHSGVFHSVESLRDRLIHVSTNKIVCPVCQEEVSGIDKLTIHLFSHVNILATKSCKGNENVARKNNTVTTTVNPAVHVQQPKKPRATGAKNKIPSPTHSPVKFVKIYPKLPVVSVNKVAVVDISKKNANASPTSDGPLLIKTEGTLVQTDAICNICGLQFIDANILRMHKCLIHNIDENTVQNFTRYDCHLCPKNFKMRGSLMVHLRVAHFGFLSGNNYSDKDTNKAKTLSNSESQEDKIILIRNDSKQWQCDVCRKCFTTKYFLKKHKRLHTGETPYACTQCNKTFTFQQSYHKHLLYHNDEKPHICNYCGRAFKELSTLHNHQRIHTGEKPFSCETCGKCFRQRVSYLVHRRIHTGVMPYKCTACQKSFRYKVSQRTHKCQAQPPGTVVRQSGELVEKLKKKQDLPHLENVPENIGYNDVSEANAELARTSAMLSLEDLESEHFSLLSTSMVGNGDNSATSTSESLLIPPTNSEAVEHNFHDTIDDLIDSIPIEDKNIPSPSEILKNLCLSKDEDYLGIFEETNDN